MRRSLDAAQTIENRSSFPNGITIIYNERPKRSLDFYDADTDTGNKSKEQMQQEMNSTRDMSKLKRYIVDTYHLRTVLLQRQNKTAVDLLDEYPLLLYSTYVILIFNGILIVIQDNIFNFLKLVVFLTST